MLILRCQAVFPTSPTRAGWADAGDVRGCFLRRLSWASSPVDGVSEFWECPSGLTGLRPQSQPAGQAKSITGRLERSTHHQADVDLVGGHAVKKHGPRAEGRRRRGIPRFAAEELRALSRAQVN